MGKLKLLLTDRRMLIVFLLGFSSGLPLLLTAGTLQAWYKEAGTDLTKIGLLGLIAFPYTLKFLWAPALDWWVPPFLGRRRGWLLIAQIGLVASLLALATSDPKETPLLMAYFALMIAFFSATQDIAADAYQLELLPTESYAIGNQIYIVGYRLGMLLASGGSLILADHMSWRLVYTIMAACMGVGITTTLFCPEPTGKGKPPRRLKDAVILPFKHFFMPDGVLLTKAFWLLAFFLLYKIGDNLASAMTTPFYLELGYTKTQIGAVVKVFGLWATIVGGLAGGTAILYLGVKKALWVFGGLQAVSTLAFTWLYYYVTSGGGPTSASLAVAISAENLTAGLGMAAYTAFMGSIVDKRFTATQYALLSSFMGMTRVFTNAPSGYLAKSLGWPGFFVFCALAAAPGLLLLMVVQTWAPTKKPVNDDTGEKAA